MTPKMKKLTGTFSLNKNEAIHRWYPYIEGFSPFLVEDELKRIGKGIEAIYDPFGGSGTTPLTAVQNGIKSYYSETNPFMAYISNLKTSIAYKSFENIDIVSREINNLDKILTKFKYDQLHNFDYQGFEKFYREDVLSKIIALLHLIDNQCKNIYAHDLAKAALACIIVTVSNMVRRGDVRYAKEGEKTEEDFDVINIYREKLKNIIFDVEEYGSSIKAESIQLSEDAREIDGTDFVNCVITSPPYLNGTNYIRNTKLELKLLGFINDENDMPYYHSKGIIAGINNVSKRNTNNLVILDQVKAIIDRLEPVAYDQRIPLMVIGYFYDMNKVLEKIKRILVNKGHFILDIGDSQFAGIHIPTHSILASIAEEHGFRQYDETILRTRRSKNGMVLTQRILRYKLYK